MVKRLQNKIAESKLSLLGASAIATLTWVAYGLLSQQWWVQFGCFAITTYLMVELNNLNALIRIYSRMVSCVFLILSCCSCFLFPFEHGAFMQLCMVASYVILFLTYQDKDSMGKTFYGFLFIGLASMVFVHILYYVPIIWMLMGTHLLSLSWRTWAASLLGMLTPYWIGSCWLIYRKDITPLTDHFSQLEVFHYPIDYVSQDIQVIITFTFIFLMAAVGTIHYIRKRHNDKIRIRLLYGFFIWMNLASMTFFALQPQHYDGLLRLMVINTSPLIAHFITLTHTRVTNIAFAIISSAALLLTVYHLWTSSYLF